MAFSLHTILGKYELAIAFGKTEEGEPEAATSVVSETEMAFGFTAPDDEPGDDIELGFHW